MHLSIHLIGKSREAWLQSAEAEYLKRLKPMVQLEIVTHRAETSAKTLNERRQLEGERLLGGLSDRELLIALDEKGKAFSSEELAGWIGDRLLEGQSRIRFVVGGADGLHEAVIQKADLVLSLSRMTFTHQMVRLVLVEQIYRALMIRAGRPYHRS
jgi:23S rRNA (pseudouridine1915-N3)-methyltransferase